MNKAKPFLFGTLLGAAIVFVALQFHVVRSHDGIQFVPRTPQHSLGLAWVDVRNWEAKDWLDRPELARALFAHGASDLVSQSVRQSMTDSATADSATVDQLRSLLDDATRDPGTADDGSLRVPGDNSGAAPGARGSNFSIPFPSAARNELDDPFRVAEAGRPADDSPAGVFATTPAPRTGTTQRRSDEVVEPFSESQPARDRSTTPSGFSPTQREAAAVEELIFGEVPATPRSNTQPASETTTIRSDTAATVPFADAASELESRARSALERANSTLTGTTGNAPAVSGSAADRFTRDRTRPANSNSAAPSDGTSRFQDRFDPFLQ